jgi:dihydrofolate reductase
LVEAVRALKNDSSTKRIALSGSVSIVRQLLDADLLDELHLFVHPATAGSGLKLFQEGARAHHFRLVTAKPFKTGVVYITYRPDPNPPAGSYQEATKQLSRE